MPFLGTIVNFFVVLICGTIGSLLKKGVPKRIGDIIMSGMAICVIYIGIGGMLEEAPTVVGEGSLLSNGLVKILVMIISMALGSLVGELIDIDKQLNRLGDFLESKFSRLFAHGSADGEHSEINNTNAEMKGKKGGNFSKGFVSCSLLFCVGAMAVNGALQDAIGNPDILFAKSVIDGIACIVMASTLGIGCAFSAFFVLVYQGLITLIGIFISGILPASSIAFMSATGSLIIVLVGTNVLGATKVKTANMIPAIFMPALVGPLFSLIFG